MTWNYMRSNTHMVFELCSKGSEGVTQLMKNEETEIDLHFRLQVYMRTDVLLVLIIRLLVGDQELQLVDPLRSKVATQRPNYLEIYCCSVEYFWVKFTGPDPHIRRDR